MASSPFSIPTYPLVIVNISDDYTRVRSQATATSFRFEIRDPGWSQVVGQGRPGVVASGSEDQGGWCSRGAGRRSVENRRWSRRKARGSVGSGSGGGHGDTSASALDHKPHLGLCDRWRTSPRVYEPYVPDARGWVSVSAE